MSQELFPPQYPQYPAYGAYNQNNYGQQQQDLNLASLDLLGMPNANNVNVKEDDSGVEYRK